MQDNGHFGQSYAPFGLEIDYSSIVQLVFYL